MLNNIETIKFKCDDCGEIFSALAIESMIAGLLVSPECPCCHSQHTYPNLCGLGFLERKRYAKLWDWHSDNSDNDK